ncbi:MAG: FecR domain-containing protein [Myxococcota bacterium]
MRAGLLALLLVPASVAAQEDPCGGVQFTAGRIVTGRIITPENAASAETEACLRHVAELVQARRTVRAVTVATRVPDDVRPAGTALPLAELVAGKLVTAGLGKNMVSAVAPRTEAAETSAVVQLSYTERPPETPIARVVLVDGDVTIGENKAERGGDLRPGDTLSTGDHAVAVMQLADGSSLRVLGGSVVKLESLTMNAKKQRRGVMVMDHGVVEADVPAGERGADFRIQTPVGTVEGDGATFRLTVDDGGARVEVESGKVDLLGKRELTVEDGTASRLDDKGKPLQPRPLLVAPAPAGPLHGPATAPVMMRFSVVEGASGYRVQLSRNASFSDELTVVSSETNEVALPQTVTSGRWFWRVSAVDKDGYEGSPSRIHAFSVPGT